jgi:excisionase family DNA binding protein
MTVEELAHRLDVAPKTVYAAIRRNQVPGVLRVGRLVRLSRAAVVRWLDGQDRVVRSRSSP